MSNIIWINIIIAVLFYVLEVQGLDNNNYILAQNPYCQQFNGTELYLDAAALDNLNNDQYINSAFSDPSKGFRTDNKLDYYIRYSVISSGLCFYQPEDVMEISKKNITVTFPLNEEIVTSEVRYEKTVNCYYYYSKYIVPESYENLQKHKICSDHCYLYLLSINAFINDPNACPLPNFETMKSPADSTVDPTQQIEIINNRRRTFISELNNFCNDLFNQNAMDLSDDNEKCLDSNNSEVTYCGYSDIEKKKQYCETHKTESCCSLSYNSKVKTIKYKVERNPIILGMSSAALFLVIGSFYSARFIKDIKMQENIKKSILNQEKEYQEANEQMMKNAYNQGYNPEEQVYNSRSRNLNTGTLRGPRNVDHTNTTLHSNSNSTGVTLGRYPPNSFTVSQDYQSSDARDVSLRRGMVVQLLQKYEGGWVMVKDINSNRQGYAPEYCLGSKMA